MRSAPACRPERRRGQLRHHAGRSPAHRRAGAAPGTSRAARPGGVSRVSRARSRRHCRRAVHLELHRDRTPRGRAGNPRWRPRPARRLSGFERGRARPDRAVGGSVHPFRRDAHHGAASGRGHGRARRAQGGGRALSSLRRGGSRARRRQRHPGRPGSRAERRGLGRARRPGVDRAPRAPGRIAALRRRHRAPGSGNHRARTRPRRVGRTLRILAAGHDWIRRSHGIRAPSRRQPRLPPVRAPAGGRGKDHSGGNGARGPAREVGMAGTHSRRRRARNCADGGTTGLVPHPGRPHRVARGRGRRRQRGPGMARYEAPRHRHSQVHRGIPPRRVLGLSGPARSARGPRGPRGTRDRWARPAGGSPPARTRCSRPRSPSASTPGRWD